MAGWGRDGSVRASDIVVGTCGWQYRDWRGVVYPTGVPPHDWLAWYARRFPVVEVDSTFYRLPSANTVQRWHEQTPPGFQFVVKASRFLTHVRRLRDPEEPASRLLTRLGPLGPKLGAILLQLPPTMSVDVAALERTLTALPGVRVAVEPRHDSWWVDEVAEVLRRAGAATVWSDRRSQLLGPLWQTAPWGYVRLHEGRAAPWPRYGRHALRTWQRRLVDAAPSWSEAFVLFNNDPGAAAVADAISLRRMLTGSP
jgi:uncharacterized protein YecE (DUF72 family)